MLENHVMAIGFEAAFEAAASCLKGHVGEHC